MPNAGLRIMIVGLRRSEDGLQRTDYGYRNVGGVFRLAKITENRLCDLIELCGKKQLTLRGFYQ